MTEPTEMETTQETMHSGTDSTVKELHTPPIPKVSNNPTDENAAGDKADNGDRVDDQIADDTTTEKKMTASDDISKLSPRSQEVERSEDAVDGSLLSSGEVNYLGQSHQLVLMHKGLRLVASQPDTKSGAGDAPVPVIDVPWCEVVCACEPPIKKTKSSSRQPNPGAGEAIGGKMFVIHYMERNKKNFKVQCKNITVESKQESADSWIMQIEEKRKEGKPQKLLIIINPIGGSGNGRQSFDKRAQPLFALAGVELVVKVTERFQHALEIAKTFDVTSVDGVVVVGGDGMYMEVLHGLILRKQEEEGVDYNNPDTELVPPTVRVGIIPGGTGNGMSTMFNGVMDIETATLNIIRGVVDRANIFATFSGEKLVQYSGLQVANGFFSSIIKRTEELRWMKRARYPYVMLGSTLWKRRLYTFDIEVLKRDEETCNTEEKDAEGAEATKESGWTKLGCKQVMSAFAFIMRLGGFSPFYPGFDLALLKDTSNFQIIKYILSLMTQKMTCLDRPFVEYAKNLKGARLQLVQAPASEEGATGSSPSPEILELSKLLNVDGELITLAEPKYEIRMYSQFLQVFSYSDHFKKAPLPT